LGAVVARKSKNNPQAVDAYLSTLPRAERESLEALRTLIKRAIPLVEERVSYGTAVMFSLGRDLVGFVSQPKHLSFIYRKPEAGSRDEGRDHEDPQGQRRHNPFFTPAPASDGSCDEDSSSTGPGECPSR
jgi:hypothetical protein